MPVIVDTWNVLLATDGAPDAAAWLDIRGLVGLISRSRFSREPVDLVCDGAPTIDRLSIVPAGRGHIEIIFAGPGKDADSVIEAMIDGHTAPTRLTIVSSDRRLRRAARRRRCRHLTSASFLHLILADAARPRAAAPSPLSGLIPLSDPEIDRWLTTFDLDDDLMDLKAAPEPPPRPLTEAPRVPTPPGPEASSVPLPPKPTSASEPWLTEALKAWPGLRLEDLDMSRWLEDR